MLQLMGGQKLLENWMKIDVILTKLLRSNSDKKQPSDIPFILR